MDMQYFVVYYFIKGSEGRYTGVYFTNGGYNQKEAEDNVKKSLHNPSIEIQIDKYEEITKEAFIAMGGKVPKSFE